MAKAAYHVLGKHMTREPQLNQAGTGIEDVHVIPYVIDSGPAAGSQHAVKVPHSEYTADNVQAAIESDVDMKHAIASMSQR